MSSSSSRCGIAFDLGTTTLVGSVVDGAGSRLSSLVRKNPQIPYGYDVTARMKAALEDPEAALGMRAAVAAALEGMAKELLREAGRSMADVGMTAVAGNPVMEHLLLGLPVERIAFPPFRPAFADGWRGRTSALGWQSDLPLFVFPLPGGYVGGDTVAVLLGAPPAARPTLYLDIGTNCEIVLAAAGETLATSAPAGPALEGGNISCGTVFGPGAVTALTADQGRLRLDHQGVRPTGLSGSAVLNAVALLLDQGLLEKSGRLPDPGETSSPLGNRLTAGSGQGEFLLYRDASGTLSLTQDDIRQVQLACAALRAGTEVLLERLGLCWSDLAQVLVTGSFGATLSPVTLKRVGILGGEMLENTRFLREGALLGAEKAVYLDGGADLADRQARDIRVVPLSGTPAFEKHFFAHMDFPGP